MGIAAVIEVLQLDVTDDDHILAAMEFVEAKYGKLDGKWISNAVSPCCPILLDSVLK